MTFNDKPKRPGIKPFVRETKPKAAPVEGEKRITAAERARAPRATDGSAAAGKPERISKIMARLGVASRRDIERMITEGRVRLNGAVLETPVMNVTLDDRIEVDGVPIRGIERTRLWLFHKPSGLVTTNSDPEGRPTVFDRLPEGLPRVLSIGRLDINTEGLLLLTNDGGLSRVLELPTTGWLRRYRVRAHGEIKQEELDKLKDGIAVDGVLYGSIEATLDKVQGSNVWITMGLREGKNREIKNVMGALGLEVNRLIRISYGPFQLGDLPEGQVLEVRGRTLRDQLGPRLIEDSKANFDAPIYDAAAEDEAPADSGWNAQHKGERARPVRADERRESGSDRFEARGNDRGAGDRKPSGDRFGGKDRDAGPSSDDRPKRRQPGSRTANVWMAPGARPVAEKQAKPAGTPAEGEVKRAPRERPEGAPDVKRYGRSKDGKPTKSSGRFDPDRKSGKSASERPDPGPRVVVVRADDDADWIRADKPDQPAGGGRGRGDGDRGAPRGERSFGDKPRGDRGDRPSFGDRPRGDRPSGDRPRGDRPSFGDKPRGDRPSYGDKPRGERPSFGDKPRGERPAFGDKPRGDRPSYGDKPRGDRPSFGDKPRGERSERSFSDRPRGDRPSGPRSDRPAGDRPRGDRPSFGDKPRGERPAFGDKPRGDRPSFGAKPFGDRKPRAEGDARSDKPRGDKPYGAKSFGDKPRAPRPAGDRPFGDKPRGEGKSFGAKPAGGKSFSAGKPRSDRPDGDKPSGGGRPGGAARGMTRGADRRR